MPTTATYAVSGMSCQHCVNAVTDEVTKVAGVTAVHVDLGAGTVAVSSDVPLDRELVRAAVDEAGYELAPPED